MEQITSTKKFEWYTQTINTMLEDAEAQLNAPLFHSSLSVDLINIMIDIGVILNCQLDSGPEINMCDIDEVKSKLDLAVENNKDKKIKDLNKYRLIKAQGDVEKIKFYN